MSLFAILGLIGFGWLVLLQLMLAGGLPLGKMAWGGTHRVLPRPFRWTSLFSAALGLLGFATVGQAAGIWPGLLPGIVIKPLLGTFAVLFAISLLGNAASKSRIERLQGVPLALILAVSCGALFFG